MPKFLEMIQDLDNGPPSAPHLKRELRRERRQRLRDAAKSARSLGAAVATSNRTTSEFKKKEAANILT